MADAGREPGRRLVLIQGEAASGVRLSTVTSAPRAAATFTARRPSSPSPATATRPDAGRAHGLPHGAPCAHQRGDGDRVKPVGQVVGELLAQHVLAAVAALRHRAIDAVGPAVGGVITEGSVIRQSG